MQRLPLLIACSFLSAMTACAHDPAPPEDDSLYQALGGMPGITAIVEETTFRIINDSRIAHYFALTDLDRFRTKLAEQICFETGGPCTYTGDTMPLIHTGMNINEADFNALVEDLQAAMTFRQIPLAAQNKLLARLAPMRGDIFHK